MTQAGGKPKVSKRGRRLKGSGFERELVQLLLEHGLIAKRVPLSGSTDFQKGDVTVHPEWSPRPLVGECKRRARLPSILTALGDHDFLALREDRGEALIVIRASHYAELLQG